jgi:hypothetical protein
MQKCHCFCLGTKVARIFLLVTDPRKSLLFCMVPWGQWDSFDFALHLNGWLSYDACFALSSVCVMSAHDFFLLHAIYDSMARCETLLYVPYIFLVAMY